MKNRIMLTSLLGIIFSCAAWANTPETLTITLPPHPHPLISMPSNQALHSSEESATGSWKGVEFAISSWSPHALRLDTLVPQSTDFSAGLLPAFSVNFLFSQESLGRLNPGVLSWTSITPVLGATFLSMGRNGNLQFSGREEKVDQTLLLVPLRIGARLHPYVARSNRIQTYFGLSLLPTFAIATRSALSDGSSSLGLPVEIAVGTEFSVAGTPLDLGLVSTVGKLSTKTESGNFFGIGLLLGLKIGSER